MEKGVKNVFEFLMIFDPFYLLFGQNLYEKAENSLLKAWELKLEYIMDQLTKCIRVPGLESVVKTDLHYINGDALNNLHSAFPI